MRCSFCKRHAEACEVILEGLNGIGICSDCVEAAQGQVAKFRRKNGWKVVPAPSQASGKAPGICDPVAVPAMPG